MKNTNGSRARRCDLLTDDFREFVANYTDSYEPSEILKNIATICNVELNNIALHKRLNEDVFELFDVQNENELKIKERLSKLARVVTYHSASSCSQFLIEAVIEFCEDNLSIGDIGEELSNIHSNKNSDVGDNHKKNKSHSASLCMQVDKIQLHYEYNEQNIGSSRRDAGVSVMESPCKSVNMTITMSRGAGGLDKCVVIDFEMLTAKNSPADNQILLSHNDSEDDNLRTEDSDDNINSDYHDDTNNDNGADDDIEASKVDDNDYYNVRVDRDALEQLCFWLNYGHSKSRKRQRRADGIADDDSVESESERHAYYQENEASQDMLMFLLSVPFVDDSWAVHTLILDHELGNSNNSLSNDEEEGFSEEEYD